MRKAHRIVDDGNVMPQIDDDHHADFILNYQRSILCALVKRGLLTESERDRCISELERRQRRQ